MQIQCVESLSTETLMEANVIENGDKTTVRLKSMIWTDTSVHPLLYYTKLNRLVIGTRIDKINRLFDLITDESSVNSN